MKKRLLSGVLAIVMVCSLNTTIFANNPTSASTEIKYTGKASSEAYWEITVPAILNPGESGEVSVSGNWSEEKKLVVTSDSEVVITNENGVSTKTLDVTFDGIKKIGDNGSPISENDDGASETLSIAPVTGIAYGDWNGTLDFQVELKDVEIISFDIDGVTFQAREDMTWIDWINSKYNTENYFVQIIMGQPSVATIGNDSGKHLSSNAESDIPVRAARKIDANANYYWF